MSQTAPDSAAHGPGVGHRIPLTVLAATLLALLALTVLTVSVTLVPWLDFGRAGNLWIALGIATAKATLVALYFMHLRYERPFNAVVLVTALVFVMLFCSIVLMDSRIYQPDIQAYRDVDPVRYAPDLERP
jgi:cytochrome c oxidase subunit 4